MATQAIEAETRIQSEARQPEFLHEFFEAQAAARPEQCAVEALGKKMTYAELDGQANRIAHWLRARGIGPGSLVGLCQNKSCQLFASMLGILKAGAGYVPLDPKFPEERIRDVFADAAVTAVITEQRLIARAIPQFCANVLVVDRDAKEIARLPDEALPRETATPDSVCYVIYTSGSTGRPNGVMIAHRNAVTFVKTLATVYRVAPQDRVYQGFSIAFDASVEEIWAAFSAGGTLVVAPEHVARSPLDVAEFITAHGITFFSTVPTFLALIDRDLPTVGLLILGGEACMQELVTRWAKPGRRLLNTYGPTETTVVATWTECIPNVPVTIGRALPGYRTFVLDENLKPVGAGEQGELFIGGDGVALGYLNRPELTAARFIDSPFSAKPGDRLYRTHDLVRLGEDGVLQFLGRIDGQVKIRGFRVELSEIETVLMAYPGIRAAAVHLVFDGGIPELAACVVVEGEPDRLDRPGVAELIRSRLPDYMTPKYLDVVDRLPTLTSGKIDRKQLPAPVELLKGAGRDVVPPAGEMEGAVAQAWEKCLQVSPVSVEDDFFLDLGGHSLLAARVVTELRTMLGTSRISVRDLYKHRTVRALSTRLGELGIGAHPAAGAPPSDVTPAELAFRSVPHWQRWICVALQAVAILVYYGIVAAPIAYSVLASMSYMAGDIELGTVLWLTTGLAFAYWPTLLGLSIALKWIVIGRYRPGQYPVWGLYYFRWWLVSRFAGLSWSHMFVGTPLMNLYYRAMGAKVGRNAIISTTFCSAFDLVTIGEGASIGAETHLLGYRVENGMLIVGRVDIGSRCFVGMHSCLGLDASMGDGARLDDMSALADGAHLPKGEGRRGIPAMPAEVQVPGPVDAPSGDRRMFRSGALHAALIYAMGYLLILAGAPGVALVAYALVAGGPAWGLAAAIAAVPISIAWYVLLLVAVKRLCIGRIAPGVYSLDSGAYLRHWFLQYLLSNTRGLLLPAYATVYLPPLLRLLGAKIGPGAEISSVMHVTPDLIDIGSGSFLADACLIGGARIHNGQIELKRVRVGEKAFIGNSALVPGGTDVGDGALLGVLSCPTPSVHLPDNERWLGSPAFVLPRFRSEICYGAAQTYRPTRSAVRQRGLSDAIRVLLPGAISATSLVGFAMLVALAAAYLPVWLTVLAVPVSAAGSALASLAVVAGVKWLLMGTFEPTVHPLWCRYVWNNEIVNGAFEAIGEAVMPPLLGTPFAASCLRLMGCRIGRWVYLESTYFSEFDLVDIGDHAAVNFGATIQTHLFEDRVMKADRLRIGAGATVGNMAVVLYDSDIKSGACLGSLSLLMKGETLPANSRWFGIPSEPTDAPLPAGRPDAAALPASRLQPALPAWQNAPAAT